MSSYAIVSDLDRASSERASFEVSPQAETKKKSRSWSESLPMLLRQAGAIAVLVSLYNFLSQGWAGHMTS